MPEALKGQVSGFQPRFEPQPRVGSILVWDFRIERRDGSGKPLPRVPVEMRGTSFNGSINNGDWVEVDADWQPGQTIRPRAIRNLTTAAVVEAIEAKRARLRVQGFLGIVVLLLIIATAIVILVTALRHQSSTNVKQIVPSIHVSRVSPGGA